MKSFGKNALLTPSRHMRYQDSGSKNGWRQYIGKCLFLEVLFPHPKCVCGTRKFHRRNSTALVSPQVIKQSWWLQNGTSHAKHTFWSPVKIHLFCLSRKCSFLGHHHLLHPHLMINTLLTGQSRHLDCSRTLGWSQIPQSFLLDFNSFGLASSGSPEFSPRGNTCPCLKHEKNNGPQLQMRTSIISGSGNSGLWSRLLTLPLLSGSFPWLGEFSAGGRRENEHADLQVTCMLCLVRR